MMNTLTQCSALVLTVVCGTGAATAGDYFVAPGGSDSATGFAGDPWGTLQHAADQVAAGDTVSVAAGFYTGFELKTSGTSGNPIVFHGQPGVVINTPNTRTNQDGINLELASHVTIDGFEITGMPRAGVRAVGLDGSHAQSVIIRNNTTDQNGYWGILAGYVEDLVIENNETSRSQFQHGIYVSNSADRPTITGNVSWGNYASGIQINADGNLPGDGVITGAVVSANTIYDNGQGGGAAINLDGVQASRIDNNLIYDSHASGIALFQSNGSDASKNNQIINNTVVVDTDGRWAITITGGSTDNTLLNNIFYSKQSYRGAMDISEDSLIGLVSDFNAVEDRLTNDGGSTLQTLSNWQTITGQDTNSLAVSFAALFEDPDTGDFRLAESSPAIDAGTVHMAPATDMFGTTRPIGATVDIGAIEVPAPGTGIALLCLLGAFNRARKRSARLSRDTPASHETIRLDRPNRLL